MCVGWNIVMPNNGLDGALIDALAVASLDIVSIRKLCAIGPKDVRPVRKRHDLGKRICILKTTDTNTNVIRQRKLSRESTENGTDQCHFRRYSANAGVERGDGEGAFIGRL